MQSESNIFSNLVFTYENQKCVFDTDIIHTSVQAPPSNVYKIQGLKNEKIRFAYVAQNGLTKIAPNGSILETNILGSFIQLSDGSVNDLQKFVERNGFIFPLSENEYENIDPAKLKTIIGRMRYTVELMSSISSIKKDYSKILLLMLLLMFSDEAEIQTKVMETPYKTFTHPIQEYLRNALSFPESNAAATKKPIAEYKKYDTVLESEVNFDYDKYLELKYDDNYQGMLKNVMYLYVNYAEDSKERLLIDFLYHFLTEIGDIISMDYTSGIHYKNTSNISAFSPRLKEVLLAVARNVIGDEINANLYGIYPAYNPVTMSPSWRVSSLLSAMYFSIFYIQPELELYRQCPRCGKYFLVRTTSTRKKYCSTECCNRQTQETYRRKKRSHQSEGAGTA